MYSLVNTPNVICSLAAISALISAIAMLVASGYLVYMAWTRPSSSSNTTARKIILVANNARNTFATCVAVLFVVVSDSVVIASYFTRLQACSALLACYAATLFPALFVTIVADILSIARSNTSTTFAEIRSSARSSCLWTIIVCMVLSFVFSG